MTRTIDSKRRVTLPKLFSPGDEVEMEMQGKDLLVVRRVKPAGPPRSRLVKRRGVGLVFARGRAVTREDVWEDGS